MTRRTIWIIGWVIVALLILTVLAFWFNTPTSTNGVVELIRM